MAEQVENQESQTAVDRRNSSFDRFVVYVVLNERRNVYRNRMAIQLCIGVYVMILSALVQFVLAGAVMNHFKKKQLDMIMCNFEKINQNRIKEALEIERKSLEKSIAQRSAQSRSYYKCFP